MFELIAGFLFGSLLMEERKPDPPESRSRFAGMTEGEIIEELTEVKDEQD